LEVSRKRARMTRKYIFKKRRGSIALTTVLVISSLLIIGGLALGVSSMDYSESIKSYNSLSVMKMHREACFDESLYRLKTNRTLTGSFLLNFENGTCTANIQSTSNANIKSVTLSATNESYNSQEVKGVDTSQTNLIIVTITP
jgi:hypothetical protein